MGSGNESLGKQSWSHDQDMVKTLKNLLLRNQKVDDLETGIIGCSSTSKFAQMMTLD